MRELGRGVIFLVGLVSACTVPLARHPDSRGTLLTRLQSAPLQREIAHVKVTLGATLWLDLMPSLDTSGNVPLLGILTVRAEHGQRLSPDLVADSVWLLLGNQSWADTLTGQPVAVPDAANPMHVQWHFTIDRTDSTAAFRLWGGPEAARTADSAVVVVRLRRGDSALGFLRSLPARIDRVY